MTDQEFTAKYPDHRATQYDADQAQINRAIEAYEEARMGARPKPKFILHIDGNHFYAKPSRGTLWDVLFVAIGGAMWFAILAGLYLVFA